MVLLHFNIPRCLCVPGSFCRDCLLCLFSNPNTHELILLISQILVLIQSVQIYITNSVCTNLYLHSACVCKTSVPLPVCVCVTSLQRRRKRLASKFKNKVKFYIMLCYFMLLYNTISVWNRLPQSIDLSPNLESQEWYLHIIIKGFPNHLYIHITSHCVIWKRRMFHFYMGSFQIFKENVPFCKTVKVTLASESERTNTLFGKYHDTGRGWVCEILMLISRRQYIVQLNTVHSKFKYRFKLRRLSSNQHPGYLYKVYFVSFLEIYNIFITVILFLCLYK